MITRPPVPATQVCGGAGIKVSALCLHGANNKNTITVAAGNDFFNIVQSYTGNPIFLLVFASMVITSPDAMPLIRIPSWV